MSFDPYSYDLASAGGRPSSPAALTADEPPVIAEEAQAVLWHGLREAIVGACDLWARIPPGHQCALPPFTLQHTGKRCFNPADLREQTLSGWHRLISIELRLAAQALEALILAAEPEVYWALLEEQCARVGQLYDELKRRAGTRFALPILRWELRLLRYRASPVVAPLIYD